MKPRACTLGLTLIHEHDVCPACGWPAGDHRNFEGRHGKTAAERDDRGPATREAQRRARLASVRDGRTTRAVAPEHFPGMPSPRVAPPDPAPPPVAPPDFTGPNAIAHSFAVRLDRPLGSSHASPTVGVPPGTIARARARELRTIARALLDLADELDES